MTIDTTDDALSPGHGLILDAGAAGMLSDARAQLATAQHEAGVAAFTLRTVAAMTDWQSRAAGHFHESASACAAMAGRLGDTAAEGIGRLLFLERGGPYL